MKAGDRVKWTYKHQLNSKSFTWITKEGTLLEITGSVKNKCYVSGNYAKVHFNGNKYPSKVQIEELKLIKSLK